MRVECAEVELAGNQEDDGADSSQARETPCAALGGLKEAVEGFEESIGLSGLSPCHDALQMTTHELGNLLHRLDLAAHDAIAPMLKHVAYDIDLLALENLAQPF